jgi:hypothetical protein
MKKEIKIFYLSFALCCLFIFLRLEITYGSDIRAPFTDDFYYYLTTSRNFIDLKKVTFDQISLTNGFQPLWFLIITFFNFFITNDILLNSVILISIFILSFLSYFNFKFFLKQKNYSEEDSNFISITISFLSLFFSKNGMEISLAIYLFSQSLKYLDKNLFFFCIFGILTFLARLEFIIFYFVILSYELFVNKKIFNKSYIKNILIFPTFICFYLFTNYVIFQSYFPESGIAKSLTKEIKFNLETFSFLKSQALGMKFISLMFYLNLVGLIFLFTNKIKIFTKFSLVTSLLFFLSNSLRSAWPLWTWHFFFLSISTPMIINDFTKIMKSNFLKYRSILVSLFFVFAYLILLGKNYGTNNDHILNLAIKISDHYKLTKYEKFAMGDMAGKTSYLLNKKLIQLEGLVGGNIIVKNIKNENSLCLIFSEMDVEIYLASKIKKVNDMYYVAEPSQNSENVKKMKSIILNKPENIFKSGNLKVYAFNVENASNCLNF